MNGFQGTAPGAREAVPGAWLPGHVPRPGARARLICFHHAGGGSSIYRTWQRHCPDGMDLVPVQLPGRENRIREPGYEDARLLGPILAEVLSPLIDRPAALFGHSLGALLAFEAAHGLRARGLPVSHLFVSSRWAPHAALTREPMHALPRDAFRRRLAEFGGTPAAILEDEELMALFEPLLRADLRMNEAYACPWSEPLDCPITAFAAADDPIVPPERVGEWARWTSGGFEAETVPGDHFHFRADPGRLLRSIASRFP